MSTWVGSNKLWLTFHRYLERLIAAWRTIVDVAIVMSNQKDRSYPTKQVNCMYRNEMKKQEK